MNAQDPRWAEITQLQQRLLEGLAAIPKPPSLGLGNSAQARASSLGLDSQSSPVSAGSGHYHRGTFGPQHRLSPEQAWEAEKLLRRANARKPITGKNRQQRYARRIQGIVSAIRNGRTGNARWGRSMLGKRGGNVLRDHAKSHLRAIARLGGEAAQAARERRKATAYWERTGEVLPLGQQELAEWQVQQPKTFLEW